MSKIKTDVEAWREAYAGDLWVYDKLILSRKLGYVCGPKGVDVPKPGEYIIRPITNILGMGRGAELYWFDKETEEMPDGYFWCEVFEGPHLSVDFNLGRCDLVVEGIKKPRQFRKWEKWKKRDLVVPAPHLLNQLTHAYDYVNIEMIGDMIIEVHLRQNPDFIRHNSSVIVPVYHAVGPAPKGMEFLEDRDADRLGFFIEKGTKIGRSSST